MNTTDESGYNNEVDKRSTIAPAFVLRAAARKTTDERRTFVRVRYTAAIDYIDGNGFAGNARAVDIGWGGFSMELGRYLRPGMRIEIAFPGPDSATEELIGVVTWCRTVDGENFCVGVRVSLDESDAVARLSARILAAVTRTGEPEHEARGGGPGDMLSFAMTAPHVA